MSRSKLLFGMVFLVAGLGLAYLAWLPIQDRRDTRALLEGTYGQVTAIENARGRYRARIEFKARDGATHFVHSQPSQVDWWSVGEFVAVHYDRGHPNSALIDAVSELDGSVFLLGFIGFCFATYGAIQLAVVAHSQLLSEHLRRHGRRIDAKLVRISRVEWLEVNDVNPWRLELEGHDPVTRTVRQFHSEQLWNDPTPHCRRDTIGVWIDPKKPQRYWVDISFLPDTL